MIAICVPSRGLIYSRCMQSVIEGMQALNRIGIETSYHTSHDLPIPDAHNFCVEQAMQNPAVEKFFMIEDDHYLHPDAFVALATADTDVTTLQYNDKNGSPFGILHYNEAGELLWGGLGSTVIKRKVFEGLGIPYFRTDTRYKIVKKYLKDNKMITEYEQLPNRQEWDTEHNKFVEVKDHWKYGGLDVDFYTRLRKNGYSIAVLPQYKSHHFQLVKLGEPYTNNGVHEIKQV